MYLWKDPVTRLPHFRLSSASRPSSAFLSADLPQQASRPPFLSLQRGGSASCGSSSDSWSGVPSKVVWLLPWLLGGGVRTSAGTSSGMSGSVSASDAASEAADASVLRS